MPAVWILMAELRELGGAGSWGAGPDQQRCRVDAGTPLFRRTTVAHHLHKRGLLDLA